MQRIRRRWRPAGLGVLLLVGSGTALAEAGPREVIEQTTGELLTEVAKDRAAIRDNPDSMQELVERIVVPHVDMQAVGRWMLAQHWRKAPPEQRQRFLEEFRKLIVRTYAAALAEFTDGAKIRYISEQVSEDGTQARVRTHIPLPGNAKPVDISYRLRRDEDGPWKVYDVAVEGVSMVATYRTTLRSRLERAGLDALIEELARKNREKHVADAFAPSPQ